MCIRAITISADSRWRQENKLRERENEAEREREREREQSMRVIESGKRSSLAAQSQADACMTLRAYICARSI